MKEVVFNAAALRQMAKLSTDVRRRIEGKIAVYAETGAGDVTPLKRLDGCRIRIGDWRVLFLNEEARIIVYAVGHRRDIYE